MILRIVNNCVRITYPGSDGDSGDSDNGSDLDEDFDPYWAEFEEDDDETPAYRNRPNGNR